MTKVELLQGSDLRPSEMISFAGRTCYEGRRPHAGHLLNVKDKLFDVGHITTLQHSYYTFYIEGIAVSDVTFGLHLASPFYNSSQRSGRYCADMFSKPDFGKIGGYIRRYWPSVSESDIKGILDFIGFGAAVFKDNIDLATAVAERFIAEERPYASKFIKRNAVKYAQEQMRVFVSTIFPTALTFTASLSAIVSLYHAAWSPAMLEVTQKMADAILDKDRSIAYMFDRDGAVVNEGLMFKVFSRIGTVVTKPSIWLHSTGDTGMFVSPDPKDIHPINLLPFKPRYMNNNTEKIEADVHLSVASLGQDQRHRTIERNCPRFTGNFYLPPIPDELGLEEEARIVNDAWTRIYAAVPLSLSVAIAPYGAMVNYRKSISYNAAIHESSKRLCWRSQEEIYHLNLFLRDEVVERAGHSELADIFPPSCVRAGKCGEGGGYCGRDCAETPFIDRRV